MRTGKKLLKNKTERQSYEYSEKKKRCEQYKRLLNQVEMKYRKNAMMTMQDENACRFLNKKIDHLVKQL